MESNILGTLILIISTYIMIKSVYLITKMIIDKEEYEFNKFDNICLSLISIGIFIFAIVV